MANTAESGSGEADKTGRILSFSGEHVDPRGGKAKSLWRISNDGMKAMTSGAMSRNWTASMLTGFRRTVRLLSALKSD